jgi:hypothetical protein
MTTTLDTLLKHQNAAISAMLAADAAHDAAVIADAAAQRARADAYDALVVALAMDSDQRAIDANRRALDAADSRLDATSVRHHEAATTLAATSANYSAASNAYLHAALDAALDTLRALDANGHATLTDGTLHQYDVEDRLAIVEGAIAAVRANA